MGSLAWAYKDVGAFDKTFTQLQEALRLTRARFGSESTNTLRALDELTSAYGSAGKTEEALPMLEEMLRICRVTFGSNHDRTLFLMSKLAPTYWRTHQLDKSIPLFEELLSLTQANRGRDHPDTLLTTANLGVNYRDAGRIQEALPLLEKAFRSSRNNPYLRWVGPELADACSRAGDDAKTLSVLKEILAEARAALPADSPELADLISQTAKAFMKQREFATAEPLIRECLAIRERALPDHWVIFSAKSLLGAALLGQGKYSEAEPLLNEGYRGMKAREDTIPPQARLRLKESLESLVQLYESTGNKPLAEQHRSQLDRL